MLWLLLQFLTLGSQWGILNGVLHRFLTQLGVKLRLMTSAKSWKGSLYNKYEILNRQKIGDNGTNRQSTSMTSFASDFQSFLQSSVTESSKSELLIYLDEPNEPIDNKHFNLLRFRNVICHRFLVLSSLSKRFLAVPVSSVSSECTFSNAGRVLDDYRSSLKPATVQALVCASSWIRGTYDDNSHPLVFLAQQSSSCCGMDSYIKVYNLFSLFNFVCLLTC
jgi:hypothetical protein